MSTGSLSIARNIQAILTAHRTKVAALKKESISDKAPDNPAEWNKAAPKNIRSFRQDTVDTQTDTLQTARSIGELTGGKSRLNVISALTKNDKVDFFSFKLTKDGKLGLSVTSDKGVHVQILKRNGQVIADNEAKIGDKKTNWEDLQATRMYLEKGEYFVKVTRSTGTLDSVTPNYGVQLSMGKYITEDYDTVETPPNTANQQLVNTNTQATANLSSVLNSLAGGNLFDFLA